MSRQLNILREGMSPYDTAICRKSIRQFVNQIQGELLS